MKYFIGFNDQKQLWFIECEQGRSVDWAYFDSFDDIVKWAWNEHKIDANFLDRMDHDQCVQACEELMVMLNDPIAI